jgi:hypothetical protein
MNITTSKPDTCTIGQFDQNEAFEIARALEHAGINAVLAAAPGTAQAVRGYATVKYNVTVSASDYSRAASLV